MYINKTFTIYYLAKEYETGLTTVNLLITKPDKTMEGLFSMTEFDPTSRPGRYVYDYVPVQEGNYLFSVYQNGILVHSQSELSEISFEDMLLTPLIEFE